MVSVNDLRAGMRVLDSDGDFIGTVTGIATDAVRIRREGVVDGEHDVPLTRFSRVEGESVYLDGPWSTILTTLGGLAAGAASTAGGLAGAAAATVGGLASSAAHAADRVGDRVEAAVDRTTDRVDHTVDRTHVQRDGDVYVDGQKKTNIWPWLLLGAAAIAAFLAMKSCNTAEAPAPVEPTVQTTAPATVPAAGPVESVTLADNTKLDITPGTITYNLYKFVTSSEATPKTFTFDKLNFDTGSAAIRSVDQPTIDSIAAIMKAYPTVQASVVGYTDATGDKATNEKLSAERSANVVKAIVAKGIVANRLNSKAGGVAATKGGADQNARRTDLVVTAK